MSSTESYAPATKNVHQLSKKLFAAKIHHEQDIYKEQYQAHLETFLKTGERALSRMFNKLSEADIVQHYYTQTPCTKNITRIFPLHEDTQAPWIATETACDELELNSKVISDFREALNTANMDLELDLIEKAPSRKNAKKQYHFWVKFTDYNANSL